MKTVYTCCCGKGGVQIKDRLLWVVPVKDHMCMYCGYVAPTIRVDRTWMPSDGYKEKDYLYEQL